MWRILDTHTEHEKELMVLDTWVSQARVHGLHWHHIEFDTRAFVVGQTALLLYYRLFAHRHV